MKKSILLILIGCLGLSTFAQDRKELIKSEMDVVLKVADYITDNTTFVFIDPDTGEKYTSLKKVTEGKNLKVESPYSAWFYWNGLLNIAMLELSDYTQEEKYYSHVEKYFDFAFENRDYFNSQLGKIDRWGSPFIQSVSFEELDDCGALGAALIQLNKDKNRKDFQAYINKAAEHIMQNQDRLGDGTFVRKFPHKYTLWGDDLYMALPFMARQGAITGDSKYFDDACNQVLKFNKYLYNPEKESYYHCYYTDNEENGVALWGRCNGWVIMAQVELLSYLPEDHSKREAVLNNLLQQVVGLSRHQDPTGLWHQLLDKKDSYLETSASAMFVYGIAKAINNGWLDARYASIALQGWKGLKTKVQDDGQIAGICAGTWIENDILFYYHRPTPVQDIHGLGAIILAGVEVLKLMDNPDIRIPNY